MSLEVDSVSTTPRLKSQMARRHVDFLYWHAVSKMRMADFQGASRIFLLISTSSPERHDAALGRAYCLIRLGDLEEAANLVAQLRRETLPGRELRLLGRLHRRCEFERSKRVSRERQLHRRAGVSLPHTLGDDQMARHAAEASWQASARPVLNG